ncbi:fimbrillin family protein [Dysgonomonas sp. UBA7698]|uniref:fimbrillin family protein n=1 Tax=Dysgonomonas sp. UBA7698 TaxID=1946427 RepID=UPI0025BD2553|nr:fimbrillin family protein [Dysgonomonas sp. UBA7698]
MKTIKFLVFAIIATMAFTACSNDDEPTMGISDDIVQINSLINGSRTKAVINGYTGEGYFENGDILGLYTSVDSYIDELPYTIGSTTLLWKDLSETNPVTFSAYYPRSSSYIFDPENYIFNAATATEPDLLVATPVTKSKGQGVDLSFNHIMHQLIIQLSKGTEIPGSLFDAKVTLLNMKSSAKVNLLTGAIDVSAASGTDAYSVKDASEIFVVAPQQLIADRDWIKIELAGKTYTFKVPTGLTELKSGKRLTLSLTLTKKPDGTAAVALTNQGISTWIDQQPMIEEDANEN